MIDLPLSIFIFSSDTLYFGHVSELLWHFLFFLMRMSQGCDHSFRLLTNSWNGPQTVLETLRRLKVWIEKFSIVQVWGENQSQEGA